MLVPDHETEKWLTSYYLSTTVGLHSGGLGMLRQIVEVTLYRSSYIIMNLFIVMQLIKIEPAPTFSLSLSLAYAGTVTKLSKTIITEILRDMVDEGY